MWFIFFDRSLLNCSMPVTKYCKNVEYYLFNTTAVIVDCYIMPFNKARLNYVS